MAAAPWHKPQPFAGIPNWIKSIPFIGVHLACIAILWTGVTTTAVILCLCCYLIRMFGITGGYHRYFAHRSYKTSRVMQFLIACLGCSALQRGPLWWAAHHRGHHRHSDTPDDPHSPRETSFWWAHVGWVLDPEYDETKWDAIQDFAKYPELRWIDRWHWTPGVLMAVICWLIGGWSGLVVGFFLSTVLTYHVVFSINSLSHLFGRRRYATSDDSRNNWVLAILTLGEGWHNNHHHYQSSANQGFYWWEIDISFAVLRVLSWFGLVWDLRRPGQKALNHRNLDLKPKQNKETAAA